jgi:hypothetical protein
MTAAFSAYKCIECLLDNREVSGPELPQPESGSLASPCELPELSRREGSGLAAAHSGLQCVTARLPGCEPQCASVVLKPPGPLRSLLSQRKYPAPGNWSIGRPGVDLKVLVDKAIAATRDHLKNVVKPHYSWRAPAGGTPCDPSRSSHVAVPRSSYAQFAALPGPSVLQYDESPRREAEGVRWFATVRQQKSLRVPRRNWRLAGARHMPDARYATTPSRAWCRRLAKIGHVVSQGETSPQVDEVG